MIATVFSPKVLRAALPALSLLILLGAITGRLPETGLTERFTAIPMLIYSWSAKADPTDATMSFSNSAASAGLVLLGLVLLFNIVAIMMRARFEKRRVGQ